ncbi:hypothetical protein FLONG3_6470 [Fusarium longipes]|uniref:Uncharacterized protein n=1 Tax=Fusarium longipes TaxID=694270 RepID=A0A395SL52_9HYPO|nr:hypothetical protein FLONG3_6470 [Fusarium longipes]
MSGQFVFPAESRFRRALKALPFLALTVLMTRAFGMAEPIGPTIEEIVSSSVFTSPGVSVPIIRGFYGVPVLDDIFNIVTVAFANLQFYVDEKAYWQSLTRKCIPCFQIMIAIGCTAPIFFFLAYVFTPAYKLTTPSLCRLGTGPCKAIYVSLIVGYYVSHFPSYFNTSLEGRNWWNWIWQLFPIWTCSIMFVLSKTFTYTDGAAIEIETERNLLRGAMGACSLISMGTWWYTVSTTNDSVFEVFVPQYLVNFPRDPSVGLRTVIQFDYICCYTAGYLWLAYHFRDLEKVGVCSISWARAAVVTVVLSFVVGPGTLFPILWLLREELLMAPNDEVKESDD